MAQLAKVARRMDVLWDEDGDQYDVKKVLRDQDTGETWYWIFCHYNGEEELRKLSGLFVTNPAEEDEDA
jgi:hypothetical protein